MRQEIEGIERNEAEERALVALRGLARKISEVTDESVEGKGGWILKGGTALVIALGLPRPSTDLDYEGTDGRHRVRRVLARALERGRREGLWVDARTGHNLWMRGTIGLSITATDGYVSRTKIDYRPCGWRDIPEMLEYDKTTVVEGIRTYKPATLVERKLATLTGRSPRWRPRDVYDAAWLLCRHPELVGERQAQAIQAAARGGGKEKLRDAETRWRTDGIMRRVAFEPARDVLVDAEAAYESGVQKQGGRKEEREARRAARPGRVQEGEGNQRGRKRGREVER